MVVESSTRQGLTVGGSMLCWSAVLLFILPDGESCPELINVDCDRWWRCRQRDAGVAGFELCSLAVEGIR